MFRSNISSTALILATALHAQSIRSSLKGTVTDSAGAAVPGVIVTALHDGTGLERKTETTPEGAYLFDGLALGRYTIIFEKPGFAETRVTRVEQTIGEVRTLDAQLTPDSVAQKTNVTEPLVRLETATAAVGAPVEQAQIRELPLNGRNWSSLTALAPGAIDAGPGDQRTIRFAGHGLDDNNFTLDGVDASGILNQAQKEYVRLAIPLDSIGEFRVESQNFPANTGTTAGGQISVASRSGDNTLHAGLFDYFRNSAFDARSPFDGTAPDPFLLNQFGADLGGPLVRDHSFFYANYEGLRQRLGQTQIGLVPSPAFVAEAQAVSPGVAPLLAAYPRGTSSTSNPDVWNYVAGGHQVDNEDSGMIRLDQHFSDRTTAFLRFSADEAVYSLPTGSLNVVATTDTRLKNGAAELFHIFSAALVNEFKFGINQDIYHTANLSPLGFTVNVSNLSSVPAGSTTDGAGTLFSYIDDATWARGRHILKFGVEARRINMNQGNSASGTLNFLSLSNLLNDRIDSAAYTSMLPLKRLRKAQFFGYVEDTYRATTTLTINLGIRYSFFNVFHETDHRAIPFDFATCGGYCPAGSAFTFPRHDDFAPRVGVAWVPGKTVVRAGAGIYHSDGQEDDQNLPISNDVLRYTLSSITSPGLAFPLDPFLANATGIVTPRDLYRLRKDMYVASWTASVQRMLPGTIVATASYLGNKGTNLLTTTFANTLNPQTGSAPYPQFGVVSWRGNDSNSTFHALQLNARRAFQGGWLLDVNYMWSHSINDGGIGGGESDTPQNVACRSCEKASSDFDVRHDLNVAAVYELPFGAAKPHLAMPGVRRAILGGWQLSGIATERTGLPVNVVLNRANSALPDQYSITGSERPNLAPGVSLIPSGGQSPQNWMNPAAFVAPAPGSFGNAGRNLVRAPALWQADAALAKTVGITETADLQFRAEVFNILNRAQYGMPQSNLSSPLSFGTITTTVNSGATGGGTPRQFQLALRLRF
jgi:hypothetical protein